MSQRISGHVSSSFVVALFLALINVSLAVETPDLPSTFLKLAGTPTGYHRVVGSLDACPETFQITDVWDRVDTSVNPLLSTRETLATKFNLVTDNLLRGSCGMMTMHKLPSRVKSATVADAVSKIVAGRIYFMSKEEGCKVLKSPAQSRVTIIHKSLLNEVDASMIPEFKMAAVRALFAVDSTRILFYRNVYVDGLLKNCVYVDGKVSPIVNTNGAIDFFKTSSESGQTFELLTQRILFGNSKPGIWNESESDEQGFPNRGVGRKKHGHHHRRLNATGSEDGLVKEDNTHVDKDGPQAAPVAMAANGVMPALTETKSANSAKSRSSGSGEANCFPSHATVELADGSTKRMDQIAVGDSIKVGRNIYSEVYMFTHKTSDEVNKFVKIGTASGGQLIISSGHYIRLSNGYAAAGQITIGDVVVLGSGEATVVVNIANTVASGLFNPQTLQGDIVVDGILCSTYTTAVEPSIAHMGLSPVRALYRLFGLSTNRFESGALALARRLPAGGDVC
jgi:desert hedgehog